MSLKKDAYGMAELRMRHTDNCFHASVTLEEENQ